MSKIQEVCNYETTRNRGERIFYFILKRERESGVDYDDDRQIVREVGRSIDECVEG